jgi:glycosyltransferase involved in cell wall biosynthesis
MSDPLVSIVLPTFNGSRYINDSIHSCVEQTYTNWELIIVDDHSNDSTPQIIAEWTRKDPRIRSIRNPNNLRLPASLNRGFAEASGTYLTWTSDDNLYRFSALQRMVTFLEGNLDYGLVYTDFSEIDEKERGGASRRVSTRFVPSRRLGLLVEDSPKVSTCRVAR